MIKLYLEKYSDGWAYAIGTGHALRGLPSVDAALDRAVRWLEAYDRIERITIGKNVTITRKGDFWGCELDSRFSSTSPGTILRMVIELGWLGQDDLYTVRMG